jgi:hypothetical protein
MYALLKLSRGLKSSDLLLQLKGIINFEFEQILHFHITRHTIST